MSTLEGINEALQEMKKLHEQLGTHDNVISALLVEVEALLGKLRMARIEIAVDNEYGNDCAWLSLQKINDKWRLIVIDPDRKHARPISDVNREHRAYLVSMIPHLIKAAAGQIEKRINNRKKIIGDTQELLTTLNAHLLLKE